LPYEGAVIGDLYIELLLANTNSDAICIPVNKLVDKYRGSDYIDIDNAIVSLKYNSLLSQIKTDIEIQTIVEDINTLEQELSTLSGSVSTNTNNISQLTLDLGNKADKTSVQNIESQIISINEINTSQAESISNLTDAVNAIKVVDVDQTVSNGIGLTLSEEGLVGINAELRTSDILLSEPVGTSETNTTLQAALVGLNNKITSAISGGLTSITSGNGLVVSKVLNNSQNISLKIKDGSNIAVDSDGIYLA